MISPLRYPGHHWSGRWQFLELPGNFLLPFVSCLRIILLVLSHQFRQFLEEPSSFARHPLAIESLRRLGLIYPLAIDLNIILVDLSCLDHGIHPVQATDMPNVHHITLLRP